MSLVRKCGVNFTRAYWSVSAKRCIVVVGCTTKRHVNVKRTRVEFVEYLGLQVKVVVSLNQGY